MLKQKSEHPWFWIVFYFNFLITYYFLMTFLLTCNIETKSRASVILNCLLFIIYQFGVHWVWAHNLTMHALGILLGTPATPSTWVRSKVGMIFIYIVVESSCDWYGTIIATDDVKYSTLKTFDQTNVICESSPEVVTEVHYHH